MAVKDFETIRKETVNGNGDGNGSRPKPSGFKGGSAENGRAAEGENHPYGAPSANRIEAVNEVALILKENREEATDLLDTARRAVDRDATAVALALDILDSRDYFWKQVRTKRRSFKLSDIETDFDRALDSKTADLSEFGEGLKAGNLLPSADSIIEELKLLPG